MSELTDALARNGGKAAEAQKAAFVALSAKLPRIAPTVPPRGSQELCTVYTLTDCHVGALAWHREGGADWDLQIAEDTLIGCFRHMIESSPASDMAVVNQLGDFLHFDGWKPPPHRAQSARRGRAV
jgi:hypothetical protein